MKTRAMAVCILLLITAGITWFVRSRQSVPVPFARGELSQVRPDDSSALHNTQSSFFSTDVVIAAAEIVSVGEGTVYDSAVCRIGGVLKGRIHTNEIWVSFLSNPARANLPKRCILVLTPTDESFTFLAIGADLVRGFIADTSDNRRHVLTASVDELAPVPRGHWISGKEAISTIEMYVSDKYPYLSNVVWKAERLGYVGVVVGASGWKDGRPMPTGMSPSFIVGDDGVIKAVLPGA
jgi:hypothetical protein